MASTSSANAATRSPHPPKLCAHGQRTSTLRANGPWEQRGRLAVLPAWIVDRARQRSQTPAKAKYERPGHGQISTDRYGQAALLGEVGRVAHAAVGTRNHTLNNAAYRLGRLVAGGQLDHATIQDSLYQAAKTCGLLKDDGAEAVHRTVRSGLQAGAKRPRHRPRIRR